MGGEELGGAGSATGRRPQAAAGRPLPDRGSRVESPGTAQATRGRTDGGEWYPQDRPRPGFESERRQEPQVLREAPEGETEARAGILQPGARRADRDRRDAR